MTIALSDNTPRVSYTVAEGVTQTAFTVTFEFFDDADLNFYVDGTLKTLTTHYTVTGGDGSTGTINTTAGNSVTGIAGGSTVVITRSIALERTTDFPSSGAFEVATLNTELDRFTAIAAEISDDNDRSIHLPDDDAAVSMTLPSQADRLGKVLGFNVTTGAVEAGPTIADVSSLSAITADISTLADIEDGTDATDAIQTVAGISSNVTTVAGISANVTTVAGITSNIAAVVADQADIGTVATNISSVNTVATNIADVITVANDLAEAVSEVETVANDLNEAVSEIDTVAGSISNVDTVGGNIANVNTVAGISANVTTVAGVSANVTTVAGISSNVSTVAGISSDVTTVAADGTDIGTVATNITNVNTVAGVSGNVTTVAGISSNVTTVAGISSDVTTVAGDSTAINTVANDATDIGLVAGSISNVNSVGGSIANVNTVASNLASVNNFGEVYRISASAPTTSLDLGDLYFDTTSDTLKVYGASGWQNAGSSINGTSQRYHYDISGTPTSVTGADANGNTLTYDAGYVDVYVNGVRMSQADVTVTSGDTVTFASALSDGDEVDIVGYGTFSVASLNADNLDSGTVPDARITGAYTGITNLTMSGDLTVDTSTLYVDSANNNVGIGTTSPRNASGFIGLTLDATSGSFVDFNDSGTRVFTISGNATGNDINTVTAIPMRFKTNNTERMRIDSSGNVGIGTSSPSTKLHISGNSSNTASLSDTVTDFALKFDSATTANYFSNAICFAEGTNVNASIASFDGGSGGAQGLVFGTGASNTEAMRIDSSGNLLVGTTDTNVLANRGFAAKPQGSNNVRVDIGSNYQAMLLSTQNDGDIVGFYKDSTGVGSIGTDGTNIYIGSGTKGIKLDSTRLMPRTNTDGNGDNTIDIGGALHRWKDLYLSGGAYLGGTGSANYLDDYEQGTWAPVISLFTSAPTVSYSNREGSYTKIGNVVYAFFDCTATVSGGSGGFILASLPFVSSSASTMAGYSSVQHRASSLVAAGISGDVLTGYPSSSTIYFEYGYSGSSGFGTRSGTVGLNSSGRITGYIVYKTDL